MKNKISRKRMITLIMNTMIVSFIYFQSGVKTSSLVAKALTNTNSNIFNVSKTHF